MFLIETLIVLIENFNLFNRKFHVFDSKFNVFNSNFLLVILVELMQNTTRWRFLHQLYFCPASLCQSKLMQICINFYEQEP